MAGQTFICHDFVSWLGSSSDVNWLDWAKSLGWRQTNYSQEGCHLFLKTSLFWNTATPMWCFHSTIADLSSCDRDHVTHTPKISFCSFEKKFADPALGWPHRFSSWQAGWSGETSPGTIHLCAARSLISQEASLEFSIWWCQNSRRWQEKASPNMQACFKSLLVSHFSVVPLAKVSPPAKPRVSRGTTQEPVLKQGIIAASSEGGSSTTIPLTAFPSAQH